MRWLIVALVLANLGSWGWMRGWLSPWLPADREPHRLVRQVNADRLRVVPLDRLGEGGRNTPVPPRAAPRAPIGVVPASPGPASPTPASPTPASVSSMTEARIIAAAPEPPSCLAFAPLDEVRAQHLRAALEAAGAQVTVQRSEQGASYLVYLPPLPTPADAQRRLAELRRIGRDDAFVMTDGLYRQGISLGVFRFEEAARAMVARLAAAGERDARVAPRAPIVVRVQLQAHWRDEAAADNARPLAARFETATRACG